MTIAELKEFFNSVRAAKRSLDRLAERAQMYRSLAYKMTGSIEAVPHAKGENSSRVENYATRLIDLADICDARARTFQEKIQKAEAIISALPKERHREVLELRYLNCKKWEDVAEAMEYKDTRSVHKVHGSALVSASKIV